MRKRILLVNSSYYPEYKGLFIWKKYTYNHNWTKYVYAYYNKEEAEEFLRTNPKRHNANVKVIEFKG